MIFNLEWVTADLVWTHRLYWELPVSQYNCDSPNMSVRESIGRHKGLEHVPRFDVKFGLGLF